MMIERLGAETLFDGNEIATLGAQFRHVLEGDAERLVLNFAGVGAMSSDVLGILASIAHRFQPTKGPVRVCGLDRVLRDMLRIRHLDRVLEVENGDSAAS